MKKFLLSTAALVAAMSVNAQVLQINAEDNLGLGSDAVALTAGTSLGSIAGVIDAAVAFDDSYKALDCKNNDYNKVLIDGMEVLTKGGVQGNTNPSSGDGSPANTLLTPVSGAVTQLTAQKDGYVYIVSKLSSNKQYTVFEEGAPIGYSLAMEIIADQVPSKVLSYTLVGEGEYNNLPTSMAPIPWVERIALNIPTYTDADGNVKYEYEIKKNGLGVIYFPVFAGCKYLVCASGSKISWSGLAFTETPATNVTVANDEGASLQIVGGTDGINTITAEKANANAPIFNLAGQQVNKAYKGVVIQNGTKFIQK
ncbi:MAG: hypothetical protein IJV27_04040 [Prevotella sp.]|nr:hypothetical protein [Prevotella sp.]